MTVEGLDALAAKLRALPAKLAKQQLQAIAREGAEPIRERMAEKAPRGDPAKPTLGDIVVSPVKSSDEHVAIVAIGPTKDAWYGRFQEFGTRHHAAQPFARPALDEEHEAAEALVGQALWRAMKDAL